MQSIDPFSYQCGAIETWNEMVSSGIKVLAMIRPLDTREERDALIPFAHDICKQYGTKLYPEDDPFLTDLLPLSYSQGKFSLLFYKADHVIEEYIRLKERKAALVAGRAYFGGNRTQLAISYGRLLSFDEESIHQYIENNQDREQV